DLGDAREGGAEGKERNPGDVVLATQIEERFIGAIEEAVGVLHTGEASRSRLAELLDAHVADTDATDLSFVAQRDHLGELALESNMLAARSVFVVGVEKPQVHHVDLLNLEAVDVRFDAGTELLGPLGGKPVAVGVPV